MILSVTIDRSSFSLADLVISNVPDDDHPWWLPEDGVTEPQWASRVTWAPESAYYGGQRPLAATVALGALPLVIYVKATDDVALATVKAVLTAALTQFVYDITVNIDGSTTTVEGVFALPVWGEVVSGQVAEGIARCTVNIPINASGA